MLVYKVWAILATTTIITKQSILISKKQTQTQFTFNKLAAKCGPVLSFKWILSPRSMRSRATFNWPCDTVLRNTPFDRSLSTSDKCRSISTMQAVITSGNDDGWLLRWRQLNIVRYRQGSRGDSVRLMVGQSFAKHSRRWIVVGTVVVTAVWSLAFRSMKSLLELLATMKLFKSKTINNFF